MHGTYRNNGLGHDLQCLYGLGRYAPAPAVEEGLRALLLTVLGSAESVETLEVMAFTNKKRKAVDENKQHQVRAPPSSTSLGPELSVLLSAGTLVKADMLSPPS